MNISFITSNKGHLLLVLNDYLYKCNKKKANKKYWVCISNGCKVYIQTDPNNTYLCSVRAPHDHEPNPEMVEAKNVHQKIKERALKELTSISMIYEQEVSKTSLSTTTVAILPTNPFVAKARQKVIPLLPQSCVFDIPSDYTTTIDGKRFLLADESLARRDRLLMFSSDRQLDLLFRSPIVYMDGTFAKSPPHFMHIYIIHPILYDICLPCVFCLLFPASKHYACIFHYFQAIYRQIQYLGRQQDYSKNETFRLLCRKIMALALIPRDQVISDFNEIRDDAEQLPGRLMDELLIYFEKNRLVNIDLWNVSTCDTRTNNVCEGENDIKRF
ncbi:unnamed protein product [Rotaria sp. Silwood2]|nr:unnamed protein product [Rotaria sp. Silwood2]CAF2569915.1 unnamed protein product [Rotaria sp. Silwood2]CAF2963772.1 unnamed protein product [Rotaria sp. Silwood2]